MYTQQLPYAQCDPLQGSHCISHGPDYETIKEDQAYEVISHSGSYPQPAKFNGKHDQAPIATYSRLAVDRNIYFTLEPNENTEEKNNGAAVVPGDAEGAQCIDEGNEEEEEVLTASDHNVANEVVNI